MVAARRQTSTFYVVGCGGLRCGWLHYVLRSGFRQEADEEEKEEEEDEQKKDEPRLSA